MPLFFLVLLWMLTFVLGRARPSEAFRFSPSIPVMLFSGLR